MARKIYIENQTIWVRFFGTIDAMDIVENTQDEDYLQSLRKLRRVVYDYSDVVENNVVLEETREFAELTKLEATLTPNVYAILIPSDEPSRRRCEYFAQYMADTSWTLVVAASRLEAKALLSRHIDTA